MRSVLDASQMQSADSHTVKEYGIPSLVLMERAALAVAEKVKKLLPPEGGRVLVVCGSGNNGGDGVAVARLLHLSGQEACFFMAGKQESQTPETKQQVKIARNFAVPEVTREELFSGPYAVVVDALFGIGLTRPVEGEYARLIEGMNALNARKVAVDICSGLDATSGQVRGVAFEADETVTFAYAKSGHYLGAGRRLSGHLTIADIGIYLRDFSGTLRLLEPEDIQSALAKPLDGHKGTFGKVLLVCGSAGMGGAAILCARACLRAGAGMVKVVTPKENLLPLQASLPEAMVDCSESEMEWEKDLAWADGLIIGPGLGRSEEAKKKLTFFLKGASEAGMPRVLDADALTLLSEKQELFDYLGEEAVLTPHVGELERLVAMSISEIKKNPRMAAWALAYRSHSSVVFKDSCTLTVDEWREAYLCEGGVPGMGTAGSGDVLAGMVGALLVLNRERPFSKTYLAAAAVALHSLCGRRAASLSPYGGMLAGDIPEQLSYLNGLVEGEASGNGWRTKEGEWR